MQKSVEFTKFNPNERVKKTNKFIQLINDDSTDEKHPIIAKQKKKIME